MGIAAALGFCLATGVQAASRSYQLANETVEFATGRHMEMMQGNCGACHSSDYISTQPTGLIDPRAFWKAEVVKMQRVYGAPVQDADVAGIVDYLVQIYGR